MQQQTPLHATPLPLDLIDWLATDLSPQPLFGTDGIRGQAGRDLKAPLALKLGFWTAQVLIQTYGPSGTVIIGQDSRHSSDMLAAALASGLTATGLNVWHLGLSPTPAVANLTAATEAVGGIMISASHNPPGDNGLKFFAASGAKFSLEQQAAVEAGLRGQWPQDYTIAAPAVWGKKHYRPELLNPYYQQLKAPLPKDLTGLRVVLDLAWGAATAGAARVFASLGAEVIYLNNDPCGDRINVRCGSTHPQFLQEAVAHYQADMGFAFDGDADRVIAVDATGRVIDGDHILYFWGQQLQAKGQLPHQTLVTTVMANLAMEHAWQALGGRIIRSAVGDRHVYAEMLQSGAMLGGEQSGHILCRHFSVSGDGLLAALHLASLVRQTGESLAKLRDQSFQPYPQVLINVRAAKAEQLQTWQHHEGLQTSIARARHALGHKGRVLVRASGTEPVIRIMVEAADAQAAHHWSTQLQKSVELYLA